MALRGIGLDGAYQGWGRVLWMLLLQHQWSFSHTEALLYLSRTYLVMSIYYTRIASRLKCNLMLYTVLLFGVQ